MNHTRWLRHYWAIALTLALGIITATGLAATGPVLVEQVLTFAFRRVLLNAPVADSHLLLSLRENVAAAGFAELDHLVRTTVTPHLADIPHTILTSGTLPTLMPWQGEGLLTTQRVNVRFYEDVRQRVTIVAGSWPEGGLSEANVVAVVVGEPTAVAYNLHIGDRLPLSKQSSAVEPDIWLEVAAIVQPLAGQDPFWFGELSPLRVRDDGRFFHTNALVARDTFFALAASHFSDQSLTFAWPVLIEPDSLTLADLPTLPDRLASLPDQLFAIDPQLRLTTGLPATVANFAQQANDVRTPLTFLTATTALLAFFFVAMAAALAAVRLQSEWDLLRSRGIATSYLLAQQVGRTFLLLLPTIGLGALLAGLLLRGLAVVGPLADVREPGWTVEWPTAAWTAVFIAAIACVLVLLWPFVGLSRQPIASRLQEVYRPENSSWWQRYYLDVILVAAGLILLGRFVGGGGLIALQASGQGADWLLVLAPLATMLGGMAILLRLFPPLLNALSHLLGHWPQSVPFLALAYSARSHRQATRLVLLFALTVALGIFAASVDDALTHNELDRAHYATGGEVRLVGTNTAVSLQNNQVATAVWRTEGSFDSAINGSYPTFNILAIEPDSFQQVAHFRADFAREPITPLVQNLQLPTSDYTPPLPLPATARNIGLWLMLPTDDPGHWQGISLDLKLGDDRGNLSLLSLAPTGDTDGNWRYYQAVLPSPMPTQLHSIWFRSRIYRPEDQQSLAYDDIAVTDAAGQTTLLEGFEGDSYRWYQVNESTTYLYYVVSNVEAHSGQNRLEIGFGFDAINPGEWYGLGPFAVEAAEHSEEDFALPALISRKFAALTGLATEDFVLVRLRLSAAEAWPFLLKVVGVVDYFPTMYDEGEAGYIVTLRDPLLTAVNTSRHNSLQATELLFASQPPTEITSQAAQVIEADAIQRSLRAFPLAVGLRSASLLGYVLATVISLGGFAAHLVFIVSQRRSQFAVLRAIGWDMSQLYGLLLIEQLVLVFSGLLLGTGLGILLAWLTLHNLNFDWGGLASAPPFVVVWDWTAVVRTYSLFAVTVLVGLGTAVLIIRRTGLQQALSVAVE